MPLPFWYKRGGEEFAPGQYESTYGPNYSGTATEHQCHTRELTLCRDQLCLDGRNSR